MKDRQSSLVWDSAMVAGGLDVTKRLLPDLLAHLSNILNEYHGKSRSTAYYDLLAGMWLENFVHNIYTAWCDVQIGGAASSGHRSIPLIISQAHASALTIDASWHAHLQSVIAHLLEGKDLSKWVTDDSQTKISIGEKQSRVKGLLRRVSTAAPKILLVRPYFRCPPSDILTLIWKCKDWLAWDDMQYVLPVTIVVDWKWRKAKSNDSREIARGFGSIVKELLPLYIPAELLEGFAELRSHALALPLARPEAMYSANSLHDHIIFKLLVAEWRESGTKLLYHQHGGGYGLEKDMAVEKYEIRVSDHFYSWGWTSEDKKISPLPPPLPRNNKRSPSGRILLNCVDFPMVPRMLTYNLMPGTIELLHSSTVDFLKLIEKKCKLKVRPYHRYYNDDSLNAMMKAAPNVIFDRKSNQYMDYLSSDLVVHNYMGTSWLETLGLNVPTIVFFNRTVYAHRSEARPYLAALENVGICHDNAISAAKFINSLGNNIEMWWQCKEVQDARSNFVQRYAKFSEDWHLDWENEFNRILQ